MKKGFTLIETLFYISLSVVLLGVIINSVVLLSSSYRSIKAVKDVEASGLVIMNQIINTSHAAVSVNAVGTSYNIENGSLALNTVSSDTTSHTNKFYLSDGKVFKDIDGSHVVPLSFDGVSVESLVFRPIHTGNSTGVKIELTIEGKHFYDTILF